MRLIDADRLKKEVLKWLPSDPCGIEEKEIPFETDIVISLLMEIEEAPTIEGEWIPCSERLPREYSNEKSVLATTDVDELRVIIMPADDIESWYRKGYVSAWMSMPEPWRGIDDE